MRHPEGLVLLLAAVVFLAPTARAGNVERATCSVNGKNLWGKVQVVDAFADLKVRVVDGHADLKVQKVDAFANSCGKWRFVSAFPDLKVQFVDAFADLTIEYVDAFPGIR